jgi:uncharacterized membrane protein
MQAVILAVVVFFGLVFAWAAFREACGNIGAWIGVIAVVAGLVILARSRQ